MTPLAEMVPAVSGADWKALGANAARLSETGSPVQSAAAAEILPVIDAEATRRAALPAVAAAPRKRAPAKKKVVPVTGHQTALPARALV